MNESLSIMFSRMIGTVAVILVVSAFLGSSDMITRVSEKKARFVAVAGLVGGIFGIYGNISGFDLNGAVISVRDIGPMLAGFTGGPVAGLIAGAIAGIHRLSMGGITAQACVVATCCIGLICGFLSNKIYVKPLSGLLISGLLEAFHLGVVLIMVKPFETALDIVSQIAVPFIAVNALGFALMVIIITYTDNQRNLAIEKSRLQSELEVASVIQHSLLPLIGDTYPGRREVEVSGSMEAAKEVGGDFYDVFFVDKDRLAILIGDVSGKGVPAALFMASSKVTLQNCIRDIPELSAAMEAANNALCARNEADMFVTVWVGILDLTDGTLRYVNAGHNPPVFLHCGEPQLLTGRHGFVLGGMEDVRYREESIQLGRGDIICLYTDGVTEAEDRTHEMFGDDRLLACFKEQTGGPEDIIGNVKKTVETFVNGNDPFDDMTMLCLKWNGEQEAI